MKAKDNITEFYTRHQQAYPLSGQFHIYRREEFGCDTVALPVSRWNFYKISLMVKGEGTISLADKTIHSKNSTIMFTNPMIPYAWEPANEDQTGYFCLFTEDFVTANLKQEALSQSPLFKAGGNHIFFPNEESMKRLSGFFENMITEMQSDYANKYDLLRSYLQLIMHEAIKMDPPDTYYPPVNASERITTLFLQLLEQQFPIEAPHETIPLKTAKEFAAQLNIHTNTLNRALKESTGKTTTDLIAARLIQEAKALLHANRWDIAEIGYTLGFEHASNFNIFFKKHTSQTPLHFRKENDIVAIS
ncbi:AraC family transcriptional regulator [Chitinophaga pinensis]|uniref:Transcriptional regulator, AraC family n=1 Tax=Chitinophaga pinensis (strain ATCC 43595 / DSM 2588 / LMG 13176 / NBRC 15968 / NCIMB 11800 / UQM 2034) TaxID=485918 RepID=A0A979GY89_CHIPD|nr:helix-turn-helix transcriptional regulator [Chitinophaga pinensis]ACU62946.1 transcriptional regulator, AraC family [Chitinophaga pinensis DSM 2588]